MRFLTNLRYAWRMLLKAPGFSATVVLVLALGIGANSAVFSIIDAVLLQRLPYRNPSRLVMVWEKNPTLGVPPGDRVPTAPATFLEWQKRATSFEAIGGFEDANLNLTSEAEPERIDGARASANFFDVLGVKPALGNNFDFAAREPERAHVAILSDRFFKTHFGGQTNVIGRALTLNDVVYTVVGILPPEFHLPASREGTEQRKPDIWIPHDGSEQNNAVEFHRRKVQVYARLKPNVSISQARSEMDAIAAQLANEDATQNAGFGANVFAVYSEDVGKSLQRNLIVLLCAVALVLLIACANVANLMLSRATARRKEMAIRKALGASSGRLVSQMLAESLLLSAIGASFGLVLAHYAIKVIISLQPAGITRPEDIHLSTMVMLFTAVISVVAAGIFGIVPAVQAARTDVNRSLNQTRGAQSFASGRARKFLIVSEVATACVLLVGAGFMMKSLFAVMQVDPGFRADHLLTMKFSMPASHYAGNDQIAAFCRQVLEKVSNTAGVQAASFSDGLPLTRIRLMKFTVEGEPAPQRGSEPTADMRGIFNSSYFDALGIRLIAGRNFTDDELEKKAPLLIVNQALAAKLWPNGDAVGQHLRTVPSKLNPEPTVLTVIGVVANTHQFSVEQPTRPEITKAMQDYTQLTLAVRSAQSPQLLIPQLKNEIWEVDKFLPVYEVHTMEEVVAGTTSERRFESFLMSIFAAIALVLAAVGIYGVLVSLVSQRTSEIGVRMALGAQKDDVLRLIVGEGVRLVFFGVAIGVAGGFILSRLLASLFFGVSASSPLTYLEVAGLMIVIALIACYLPAARAARIDPMKALRYE